MHRPKDRVRLRYGARMYQYLYAHAKGAASGLLDATAARSRDGKSRAERKVFAGRIRIFHRSNGIGGID